MCRWFTLCCLAVGGLAVLGNFAPAKAVAIRLASVPERAAIADVIVVGKVTAIEDKLVETEIAPGQKVSYKVASIKVSDGITGAKGVTHVRVGFIPAPAVQPPAPGGGIRPIRRGGFNPTLEIGQEGCFFLAKFAQGEFFVIPPMSLYLDKKAEGFDKQLALVRKTVAVVAEPMTALKAKEAADRFDAAAILVQKHGVYPTGRAGKVVRKPIDAVESKLILVAILEADWSKNDDAAMSPLAVFQRLGLQPADGFQYPQVQPVQDFTAVMQEAAKKWLKTHVNKYRVLHWVEEK
jgi:hypothetical protein